MMDTKEIKKILATLGLAGLIAGAGLSLPGCASG
jgi:radical SAM modification target selenobiotic family peptide